MLTEQYRMHPDISAWPSHYFYDGRITDAASLQHTRCMLVFCAAQPIQ